MPTPPAASPIAGLLFIHVNVAPATGLVKLVAGIATPLHTIMFAGTTTVGDGFTVIVNVIGVPGQPAALGVMVIVPDMATPPPFVAMNEGTLPAPAAAKPMAGLEFVHVKVVPAVGLVIVVIGTVAPVQIDIGAIGFTVGIGFTVTTKLTFGPTQDAGAGLIACTT